ncbi:MAG: TatD family hydrolase [Epsilonproteobacteria bacterium]|nr:TatD family hydrolase [Campylobacterota bacterium]
MLIDTHTHLDNQKYINDVDEVIQNAKAVGVEKFIIPAADPRDITRAVSLAQKYEDVYFAVGVHPIDIQKYNQKYLLDYITHEKCVAVGEIGLDYHYTKQTRQEQIKYFREQLLIAHEYDKPVIIHIREATQDSLDVLSDFIQQYPNTKGVLHCFNADERLLCLKDNFYYGIGGVITFKNAKKLINVFPKIPKDRVVIETDSPYLTPHPYRGSRNEPKYTTLVRDKIASLWNISTQEVEDITTKNATELFGI